MNASSRGRPGLGWVLVVTAAAALIVALDQLVVATALDRMRADLHASMASLEWTVSAFALSFASLIIPAADMGDRIGRKRIYLIGLVVFAEASGACAVAPAIGVLIAARVVQGAGAALISPAALALLTAATPASKRGTVMGVYAAVMGLAVVGGPLVGGAVTQGLAWQWVFWINIPVIAIVLPAAALTLSETPVNRVHRFDLLGLILIAAAMFCISWGLVRSGPSGWSSVEVLSALIIGGVLLGCFIAWELRVRYPMLPMKLFRHRGFAAANVSTLMLTASLFSTVFFLAQYLQVSLGATPLGSGLRYLPWTFLLFVVPPIAGRLLNKVGARWMISVGLAMQGVGMLWLAGNAAHHLSYPASVLPLVISGAGTSMAMPAQQAAVMGSVPPTSMGHAAGTFNTVRQLGGAVGIAILAAVFAAHGATSSGTRFADGFAAAMCAAALMAFIGAGAGLLLPGRQTTSSGSVVAQLERDQVDVH